MLTKESIKQFLKPDWRKVLICIIIFLAFVPSVKPHAVFCKVGAPCLQPSIQSVLMLFIFFGGLADKIIFSNLFVGLVISYFISCFLISIWDKIKGKKLVV